MHWGDGDSDTYTSAGVKTHTYADGPNTYAISVDLTDEDDTHLDRANALSVDVANVKPSITLAGPDEADEGDTKHYTFVVSDPGDDAHTVSVDCGANGDEVPLSFSYEPLDGFGSFDCAFPDGPAVSTVTATVTDSDGAADTDNQLVEVDVANLAPIVTLLGAVTANEGDTVSYSFSTLDPGDEVFTLDAQTCDGGSLSNDTFNAATGAGSFDCTWADNADDQNVSVTLGDGTTSDSDSLSVDVANVRPSIAISGDPSVDEGAPYSLTLGAISDPGSDTVTSWTVHWGDGDSDTYTSAGVKTHTYADGPNTYAISVDLTDEDDTHLDRANALSVDVANLAPIVTLLGAVTANEGDTVSYSFSTLDPGDEVFTLDAQTCDGGSLSNDTFNAATGAGSFDCTWADNADDQNVSVTLGDGTTSDSDSLSVDVANVDPLVILSGPASSDEGQTQSYTFAITDAGADTFTVDASDCGATGVQSAYLFDGVDGSFDCSWADNADDQDVSVTVSDDDGGSDSDSLSVDVANVRPSIAISGDPSVDEGAPYSLTLGAISDPGSDTVTSWTVHWGDGDSDTYTSAGVKTHTYADGPNTYAISVDLTDEDDTHLDRANALSVDVANVKPSITLAGPDEADEGDTKHYTFVVSDPGDDAHTVSVDCGANGDEVPLSFSYEPLDGFGSFDCAFPDGPAVSTVTATVTDSDGAADTDNQLVEVDVANLAPIVTLLGAVTANEGDTVSYSFSTLDPGDEVFTLDAQTCDGGSLSNDTFNAATGAGSFDCTWADNADDQNVSVTLGDGTTSDSDSLSVDVANVRPSIAISGDPSVDEGAPYSLTLGAISDPGSDTVTSWTVHWGDGDSDTYTSAGVKTHTYADGPNTYAISVDLTDEDDTHLDRANALSVDVANLAPIVTLLGAVTANEGDTVSYSFSTLDPGDEVFTLDAQTCDGGSLSNDTFNAATGAGSFDCTWADNADDQNVSVTLGDGTTSDSDSLSVDVANVDPLVILSGPASSDEGQTQSYTFAITDAGADTFTVDASDCGATGVQSAYLFDGVDGSFDCSWADNADDQDVSVTVSDDDGGSDSDSLSVDVANLAPIVTLLGAVTANEGDTVSYSFTTLDPGDEVFTLDAQTCDGGSLSNDTFNAATGAGSFDCTFATAGVSDVSVTVSDGDGGAHTDSITVEVLGADLALEKTAPAGPITIGDEFDVTIKVTNNGPADNDGFTVTDELPIEVTFVSATTPDCVHAAGTVTCTSAGLADGDSVTWTITVRADLMPGAINTATIATTETTDPNAANDSDSSQTTFAPGSFLTDVVTGDPDWTNHIDGVDVLFSKSGSGSTTTYKLKATNPGTFRYRLSLENETGLDIRTKGTHLPHILRHGTTLRDRNGASTTVYLTVPSMPTDTGTGANYPLTAAQKAEPAFVLDGWKPVRAAPNDWSDDMPITVSYIPHTAPAVADCSTATGYIPLPSSANGKIARCLRIEGLEIQRHREAHIHVAYEFRWKDTTSWGSSSVDPTIAFRAGFNFKSTTAIELLEMPDDVEDRLDHELRKLPSAVRPAWKAEYMSQWSQAYKGSHALGLVFAGERSTSVGGFVFDPSANGRPDITVRLFSSTPSSANRCNPGLAYGSGSLVASTATSADGFYFVSQTGNNTGAPGPNTLPSGFKYYVALCDFTAAPGSGTAMPFAPIYWPARSMSSSLGNKEFAEEDFYVSGPTSLAFTAQPVSGRVNRTLGTVKVSLMDGFGQVLTLDTGTGASTVTLSKAAGPGTLTSSSSLTKTMVQGVVTWTDLKLSATGVHELNADANGPAGSVPDKDSLPMSISP